MAESIILDANITPLKKQLKDANQELQVARQKFGDLSTEAVAAAKKVGLIRDAIESANESAQLFDPGKRFQALTTAASTAAGGIAAVQGAMALFGGESEEVEKALLKVQGAMALSQGLSQLKDVGKVGEQLKLTFRGLTTSAKGATGATDGLTKGTKGFGKAIIATGIGILVVGLGLLIANFDKVKEVMTKLFPVFEMIGKFVMGLVNAFTDFIGVTSEAERSLESLGKATERTNEDIDNKIKLLSAQGGKETEIFELKKKQIANELQLLKETAKTKGKLTEEEEKKQRDLLTANAVENASYYKQQEEANKAAADKKSAADKAANDKATAEMEKQNAKVLEAQAILDEAKTDLMTKQQQDEAAIQKEFEAKSKKLKEAGIEDDGSLEKSRQEKIKAIKKQYADEEAQREAEFQNQLNDIITQIRLNGIKDENVKAREQILLDYEAQRQDVQENEKLKAEEKVQLLSALAIQEQQALDTLQDSIDLANSEKAIAKLDVEMKEAAASFDIQRNLVLQKQALLDEQYQSDLISQEQYNQATKANADARVEIDKKEVEAKMENASKISGLLSGISNLVGKETAAGKATAIAATTIDTYLSAQKAYQSMVGIPVVGPALATVAAGVAIAGGLKNIREITKVKVPGGGSAGSAPSINASAPQVTSPVPTIGNSPVTALGQAMQQTTPLRAYVVESEVTGTQKRVADIERRAGF